MASICKYYGATYSTQFIASLCDVAKDGMSLLSLAGAARNLGLDSMCVAITSEKIFRCDLPAILHWNQNHYVILYKVNQSRSKFYICDPAKGLITLSQSEFYSHWLGKADKGVVMMLEPTEDFSKTIKHSNKAHSAYRVIVEYLKKYRHYLFQIFIGLLFGSILQLIMPFLTQLTVDIGIKRNSIPFVWLILIGELVIVIGKTLTNFIRRWLMLHMTMQINVTLVSEFFLKLLSKPMSFFDTRSIGDLTQRINDHKRVETFLTDQLLDASFSILSLLIFSIVLAIYSRMIFLIFLIGSLMYCLWMMLFLRKRKNLNLELFEVEAITQSKSYQFLSSMQEIKLQNCKQRRRWEWEDCQADLFLIQQKSLRLQQTQEAGSILINEVKDLLITIFAATSVIEGHLSLGSMMAIQYMTGQLTAPVDQLMGLLYSVQDMRLSLERINEIHNSEMECDRQGDLNEFKNQKGIELRNVCFKYNRYSPDFTLKDISFSIPPGKVTAIVGASGSGKTTLLKLLLGYYPSLSGEVMINGSSIEEYNLDWWRNQCGVVLQEGYIFTESIARNIAVGDSEIDWEQLNYACRIANIADYIASLPLKYHTVIGKEGRGLSQGQKQRILIARAVYKNPDFIFLDEATNALDATNERCIVDNLNDYYIGKTVIVVAHRLSTVKNADQIIVIDKGQIAEIGNHETLIANAGHYFNLIKNQLDLGT